MKDDERDKLEWTYEDGIYRLGPPKRSVSVRSYLYGLLAADFPPSGFMPAGQYCIPGPPPEVAAALEELEAAANKMAAIRNGRSKGGRVPKHLPGLQAAVDRLATAHPEATAHDLWNLIPENDGDDEPIGGFIIYRDGSKAVQLEDSTGREKAISERSFQRYVTRARRK
jgi:hypothetical protein